MRPMLACSDIPTVEQIPFPVVGSYKLDGIRCIAHNGVGYSRSGKLIPNLHIQSKLKALSPYLILDGELMIEGDFNSVQSAVMSVHGEPDFTYHVFDCVERSIYVDRYNQVKNYVANSTADFLRLANCINLRDENDLSVMYEGALAKGYEGLILRTKASPYKHGRSTMKQGWMLKLKPKEDMEGTVIAVHELLTNENAPELNELGYQSRSHSILGKVGADTMGSLELKIAGGIVKVGTGFDMALRNRLWQKHQSGLLVGSIVTFEHLGLSKYGIPRCPVFKGIRLD